MNDKYFRFYVIYILLYFMLYYVLVYECVLVQMLSATSGVLSFNRFSDHSVVVLQVFLSSVPV